MPILVERDAATICVFQRGLSSHLRHFSPFPVLFDKLHAIFSFFFLGNFVFLRIFCEKIFLWKVSLILARSHVQVSKEIFQGTSPT